MIYSVQPTPTATDADALWRSFQHVRLLGVNTVCLTTDVRRLGILEKAISSREEQMQYMASSMELEPFIQIGIPEEPTTINDWESLCVALIRFFQPQYAVLIMEANRVLRPLTRMWCKYVTGLGRIREQAGAAKIGVSFQCNANTEVIPRMVKAVKKNVDFLACSVYPVLGRTVMNVIVDSGLPWCVAEFGGTGHHQDFLMQAAPAMFKDAFLMNYMFSTDTNLYGENFRGYGLLSEDGILKPAGQTWLAMQDDGDQKRENGK